MDDQNAIIKDLLDALALAISLAPKRDGYGGFKETPRAEAYPAWEKVNAVRARAVQHLERESA